MQAPNAVAGLGVGLLRRGQAGAFLSLLSISFPFCFSSSSPSPSLSLPTFKRFLNPAEEFGGEKSNIFL